MSIVYPRGRSRWPWFTTLNTEQMVTMNDFTLLAKQSTFCNDQFKFETNKRPTVEEMLICDTKLNTQIKSNSFSDEEVKVGRVVMEIYSNMS